MQCTKGGIVSLTVRESLQLEYLNEFKLLAGESGLNRIVRTTGILDHEILEDMMSIFVEGEFVLSTLSIARDDVTLVKKAIKSLSESKAAALAFKSVYYETLPDDILHYANRIGFPIFVFDQAIFIENIIGTVFNSIRDKGIHTIREMKLETLFKGELMPKTIRTIATELNPDFKTNFAIYYFKENRFHSEDDLIGLIEKYERTMKEKQNGLYKFKNGLVYITTYNEETSHSNLDFNNLIKQMNIHQRDYTIGESTFFTEYHHFDLALKESFFAYESAVIHQKQQMNYRDAGLTGMLMAFNQHPWAERFSDQLIKPLLKYDEYYNTALFDTLKLYFNNDCKTKVVAELLFQHKNTVLYRLNKVKEITGPFQSEQDFHEQLSTALKIYESKQFITRI